MTLMVPSSHRKDVTNEKIESMPLHLEYSGISLICVIQIIKKTPSRALLNKGKKRQKAEKKTKGDNSLLEGTKGRIGEMSGIIASVLD